MTPYDQRVPRNISQTPRKHQHEILNVYQQRLASGLSELSKSLNTEIVIVFGW